MELQSHPAVILIQRVARALQFIGNRAYLKARLLPALIDWRKGKRGCVFFTEASINLADDPVLMEMMVRAGFDSVFIGIESPDPQSLAECRKTQNRDRDLLENVRRIQKAGLQVSSGFIVGFDCDTPAIFLRHIDFIQRSGIVTAMVGLLQAPPGDPSVRTPAAGKSGQGADLRGQCGQHHQYCPQDGIGPLDRRLPIDHGTYPCPVPLLPAGADPAQSFRPAPGQETYGPAALPGFRAILPASGGVGKGVAALYWYLLLWTLLRKPRQLPLAVTLTIYGHHFRRICEMNILGAGLRP